VSLRSIRRFIVLALVGAFAYWFMTHSYWTDEMVQQPPRGEALTNPFYAAERLTQALGARASNERLWKLPPEDAVVVMAFWDWDRSRVHREALEHWVESGGRLVTDLRFSSDADAFTRWSGINRRHNRYDKPAPDPTGPRKHYTPPKPKECLDEVESGFSLWPATGLPRRYQLCGYFSVDHLVSTRAPVWQVGDTDGVQALRVNIGRGSVTVVNGYGTPFTYAQLLKGTHATLFVAATQLHSGDDVHFFSDQDHEGLLALTWRFGFPVMVLLLGALVFALWRAAPRFGPAMAPPERARRSLAEQIRGTGQFLLRVGDGQALHAATVRALLAAASRRISAFSSLSSVERIRRLAHATGFSEEALATAVNYGGARQDSELRSAIALLEAARREILTHDNRSKHGT